MLCDYHFYLNYHWRVFNGSHRVKQRRNWSQNKEIFIQGNAVKTSPAKHWLLCLDLNMINRIYLWPALFTPDDDQKEDQIRLTLTLICKMVDPHFVGVHNISSKAIWMKAVLAWWTFKSLSVHQEQAGMDRKILSASNYMLLHIGITELDKRTSQLDLSLDTCATLDWYKPATWRLAIYNTGLWAHRILIVCTLTQ